MIKKQQVKSRKVTKVTFELSSDIEAEAVHLLADFNGWQPVAFDKLRDGRWRLVQEVAPGQSYQFRYMLEQDGRQHFMNDPEADRTVANDRGTENAVIDA